MIFGIGVDITDITRIDEAQTKNPHFARKVLTDSELAIYTAMKKKRALEYLAGRFSAKEAYAKAYGTGFGAVTLHSVEILDDDRGKPSVTRHPYAGKAFVSISHTDALVMTEVILEEKA